MTEFTVLSWNIFWGLGAPKTKLSQLRKGISYFCARQDRNVVPAIAHAIKAHNPNIVALQEVDTGSMRNGRFNQVAYISHKIGLPHTQYAVEKNWLNYVNDGNVLLSKKPYNSIAVKELPYNLEKRNLIIGRILISKKPVTVLTTHLGAHKLNQGERMKQVREICKLIPHFKPPVILMGDFNCQEGDTEFTYLVKKSDLVPIITEKTYPSYNPTQEFDQIFVSKDITVVESGLVKAELSDHVGVYARLRV